MKYRVVTNDPGLPSVMAEATEVEADGAPDLASGADFIVFTRGGTQVALFRRERVLAVYEVPDRAK